MARRSRAREVALQLLYESDRNPGGPQERDREFVETRLRGTALRQFALDLVAGVRAKCQPIDHVIQQVAQNWAVSRMTPIDRSILRLATYEVLFCPDTPPKVAIDEAIELAKRFGTGDSARFVNGILDRILMDHPRSVEPPLASESEISDLAHPTDSLDSSVA
jgi:N utilization substance protein B